MPIYEYECVACGRRLDELQRFSDAPLKECPDCGELKLKRLISAAGFRLAGKGWYETDFKNNMQRNLKQKDSAEEKKSAKADNGAGKDKAAKSGDVKTAKDNKPAKSEGAKMASPAASN